MTDLHSDRILILDFGAQYIQLIARRVREAGVYCEIHPFNEDIQSIRAFAPKGIILSGGPATVTENYTPRPATGIFELDIPLLGICYGMQCMAHALGGRVETSAKREYGHAKIKISNPGLLFAGLSNCGDLYGNIDEYPGFDVWMSHGDKVIELPHGFTTNGFTDNSPLAAIGDDNRRFYGVQFHPEVTQTEHGPEIIQHFVHNICDCGDSWTPTNIMQDAIHSVREQVGTDQVVLGLSGGVDSSVVAALLHRAIGKQLNCIFVDTGLLRLHEGDQVVDTFKNHMGLEIVRINAEQRFLDALKGVADPEQKRKIIGRIFIEVFEEQAGQFKDAKWLAQGTIYPDVIESAGTSASTTKVIKSHHNVGGLPEEMSLKLLEPLRELFKDEVRKVGIELGLPHEMVYRHPFPGPGLGVRILGEVTKEYANLLREADAIFMEELVKNDWYDKVSQAFAVFLPVKSVGVVGDNRAYEYVIALRAVETVDFMTAKWAHLPYDLLAGAANRIINEVQGISRVTYDISSKPPATIEWE